MNSVNGWLMGLAFLLGLLVTFAFMIRRVKREVPVYAALGRGPGTDVKRPDVKRPDVDVRQPDVKLAAAGSAGDGPYGLGSFRSRAGTAVPSGYTVKGNEDSMLYHTVESPSYKNATGEVWFRDVESAERAGFNRWDLAGAGGAAAGASATAKFASVAPGSERGPYGAGSARAGTDGSGPAGWAIKGNEDSMLYHTIESPSYEQTIAEVWFVDEEAAVKAGFGPWHKGQKHRPR